MNANLLTLPQSTQSTSRIDLIRQRVLRIHGSLLLLVALSTAVYSTIARYTGIGPYAFLQENSMVWIGLIQAYLLMALIAVCLLIGARQPHPRTWDVIGALAHGAPLIAVILLWSLLNSFGLVRWRWLALFFTPFGS